MARILLGRESEGDEWKAKKCRRNGVETKKKYRERNKCRIYRV
jgi:hypothetical protein